MKSFKYIVTVFAFLCLFSPAVQAQPPAPLDASFNHLVEYAGGTVTAIAKQPDGTIIVGGNFTAANNADRSALARFNADGTLDESFNANATIAVFPTGIRSIIVQADGKILVGGFFTADFKTFGQTNIVRLNANGTRDTSFTASTNSAVFAVAQQPDGKILIGGAFTIVNGVSKFGLARLNSDGTLDTSFTYTIRTVFALAIQPDGSILIGGNFALPSPNAINRIVRVSSTGTLDTAFIANAGADNAVNAIRLQTDGKILLGGSFTNVNGAARAGLARLNSDGTLDTGFNASITGTSAARVDVLALDGAGKIVIGGLFSSVGGGSRSNIARINADGSLDTSFNPTGANLPVRSILVESEDRLLVGGDFQSFNNAQKYRLAKLNSDGSLVESFNSAVYAYALTEALEVQPDGKVLVGGGFGYIDNVRYGAFARLNADGSLDTSFAGFEQQQYAANGVSDIEVQPDGKILVAGSINLTSSPSITYGVVRLNGNGTLDNTFAPVRAGNVEVVKILPNGQILIGGSFLDVNGTFRPRLARLNSNGSLDTDFTPNIQAVAVATVLDMHVRTDGKFIIAGYFNSYNGTPKNNIALINADGTLDNSFTADPSDVVYSLAPLADGSLIISGTFTSVNGAPRNRVAKLSAAGQLDNSFIPPTNVDMPFISVKAYIDGRVILTGNENFVDPPPNYVVVLNADGSTSAVLSNSQWFNGSIYDAVVQADGKVIFGGIFTRVGNTTRIALARFNSLNFTRKGVFDFDGDGKTDLSIFRSLVGEWWYNRSSDAGVRAAQFGASTDKPVPADFTGDGKTDIAFWRSSTGEWFMLRSEDGSFLSFPFGASGDVPTVGDFDGDGKTDPTIYRPASNEWFILRSSGGTAITTFGAAGDVPVPADFDGDGKTDIAIFRPADGSWWYVRSSDNQFRVVSFGLPTDKPVGGDYTGDGKADIAVYRPATGEWFFQRSEDGSYYSVPFGAAGDIPAPGDYDGDGKFDTAVFRPNGSTWYVNRSTAGLLIQQFGLATDTPIPSVFVP